MAKPLDLGFHKLLIILQKRKKINKKVILISAKTFQDFRDRSREHFEHVTFGTLFQFGARIFEHFNLLFKYTSTPVQLRHLMWYLGWGGMCVAVVA